MISSRENLQWYKKKHQNRKPGFVSPNGKKAIKEAKMPQTRILEKEQ